MNDMGRMPDSKTLRHLRVFVSSTFNDMMEERNVLLERFSPESHLTATAGKQNLSAWIFAGE